jgi:hypothetical protein
MAKIRHGMRAASRGFFRERKTAARDRVFPTAGIGESRQRGISAWADRLRCFCKTLRPKAVGGSANLGTAIAKGGATQLPIS